MGFFVSIAGDRSPKRYSVVMTWPARQGQHVSTSSCSSVTAALPPAWRSSGWGTTMQASSGGEEQWRPRRIRLGKGGSVVYIEEINTTILIRCNQRWMRRPSKSSVGTSYIESLPSSFFLLLSLLPTRLVGRNFFCALKDYHITRILASDFPHKKNHFPVCGCCRVLLVMFWSAKEEKAKK